MAASASVLSKLIETKVHANMSKLTYAGYSGPLGQPNPSYYKEFCKAIGTGFALGSVVVQLKSEDKGKGGTPPVPGKGVGVGIFVDKEWFHRTMYIRIRAQIVSKYKRTLHEAFPPSKGNSGEFLFAITKGIADSVEEHYKTAYKLQGVHPLVYQGVGDVKKGMYSGLSASAIEGLILSNGPRMKGSFWPIIVKTIASVYVEAIHKNSTGTLTISGKCVTKPGQACNKNKTGFGSGVAI
jgi:hypothetical protein